MCIRDRSTWDIIRTKAIYSFLFKASENATKESSLLNAFGANGKVSINLQEELKPLVALPLTYYLYPGSQTYPECRPEVNWYIFDRTIEIPKSQASRFRSVYPIGNARKLQNGATRRIIKSCLQIEYLFPKYCFVFVLFLGLVALLFKLSLIHI
eukprot:TRINITY_DN10129_c0_g1_i1.p1 TRINITY_DN10129_c0_g1~~TRINITY_DN10129_c0_g1_i1.p1  ORF type:complete len:174 (-),score=35.67 TRINITY_DN10129_c0_g1_i1:60-521(-)